MKVQAFGSLEDLLSSVLGGALGDPREAHEQAMEHIIKNPKVIALQLATKRTVTKLSAHAFHISSEGYNEEDPHILVLTRNPMNTDRWRLYSICPRTRSGLTSYRLRGTEESVIHQAQLIVDLALGLLIIDDKIDLSGDGYDDHDEGHHRFGTRARPQAERERGIEDGDTGGN